MHDTSLMYARGSITWQAPVSMLPLTIVHAEEQGPGFESLRLSCNLIPGATCARAGGQPERNIKDKSARLWWARCECTPLLAVLQL